MEIICLFTHYDANHGKCEPGICCAIVKRNCILARNDYPQEAGQSYTTEVKSSQGQQQRLLRVHDGMLERTCPATSVSITNINKER